MRTLLIAVGSAITLLVAVPGSASAYVNPDPDFDIVRGGGSDTTVFVMMDLANAYNKAAGCEIINSNPTGGDPQRMDLRCRADIPGVTITNENYDHDHVLEYAALGSGNGRTSMCNLTTATQVAPIFLDYARVSSPAFGCTGAHNVAYAREGLAWMHWPKSNALDPDGAGPIPAGPGTALVTNLTTNQLAQIYSCNPNFDTWGQDGLAGIGVAGVPVVPFTAQPGSGTRNSWDQLLGNIAEGPCVISVPENNTNEIYAAIHSAAFNRGQGALFYTSTAAFVYRKLGSQRPPGGSSTPFKNNKPVLGNVDGVAPTNANISSLAYPFGRYVYNQYCSNSGAAPDTTCEINHGGAASTAALDFMGVADATGHPTNGFICKTQTQHAKNPETRANYGLEIANIIKANGFIPLPVGNTGGLGTGQSVCRIDIV